MMECMLAHHNKTRFEAEDGGSRSERKGQVWVILKPEISAQLRTDYS